MKKVSAFQDILRETFESQILPLDNLFADKLTILHKMSRVEQAGYDLCMMQSLTVRGGKSFDEL